MTLQHEITFTGIRYYYKLRYKLPIWFRYGNSNPINPRFSRENPGFMGFKVFYTGVPKNLVRDSERPEFLQVIQIRHFLQRVRFDYSTGRSTIRQEQNSSTAINQLWKRSSRRWRLVSVETGLTLRRARTGHVKRNRKVNWVHEFIIITTLFHYIIAII